MDSATNRPSERNFKQKNLNTFPIRDLYPIFKINFEKQKKGGRETSKSPKKFGFNPQTSGPASRST